ncbi:MAG: hypothetical protein M3O66_06430, partial [Verrucomicrobiota bacterium]|nr:hypothetical protein [Verrucomicrobiota bacterium]
NCIRHEIEKTGNKLSRRIRSADTFGTALNDRLCSEGCKKISIGFACPLQNWLKTHRQGG